MERVYTQIMKSDLDIGVLAVFDNLDLPPLEEKDEADEAGGTHTEGVQQKSEDGEKEEPAGEAGITHTEGVQQKSRGEEEEEEPAEEEGVTDKAETFENFKEEHKKTIRYFKGIPRVYRKKCLITS